MFNKQNEEPEMPESKLLGAVMGIGMCSVIVFVMATISRWIGIP